MYAISNGDKPILSLIIPTCGRPEFLRLCLQELNPGVQKITPSLFEVIVSDDSPSVSTENLVNESDLQIRYVKGPCRGPAANRNYGASNAVGEWIVFLDDDCIPESGLLRGYLERIALDNTHRVIEGRISPLGTRNRIDEEAPINEKGGLLWSCNFCIKSDLFRELGGFDEAFTGPAMEDVDLRERLRARGERINFANNAAVFHPWRRRRGMAFSDVMAKAHHYYFQKHGRPERFMVLWCFQRLIRGVTRNVLIEGNKYHYRGALRYILLECHSFLTLSRRLVVK